MLPFGGLPQEVTKGLEGGGAFAAELEEHLTAIIEKNRHLGYKLRHQSECRTWEEYIPAYHTYMVSGARTHTLVQQYSGSSPDWARLLRCLTPLALREPYHATPG